LRSTDQFHIIFI